MEQARARAAERLLAACLGAGTRGPVQLVPLLLNLTTPSLSPSPYRAQRLPPSSSNCAPTPPFTTFPYALCCCDSVYPKGDSTSPLLNLDCSVLSPCATSSSCQPVSWQLQPRLPPRHPSSLRPSRPRNPSAGLHSSPSRAPRFAHSSRASKWGSSPSRTSTAQPNTMATSPSCQQPKMTAPLLVAPRLSTATTNPRKPRS